MTDFSSGDWTSTSSEGNTGIIQNHSGALIWPPPCKKCEYDSYCDVVPAEISPSGSKSRATPSCSATANACSKFERLVCVDTRVMSTMSGLQWTERERREEGDIMTCVRSVKVPNSFTCHSRTCICEWWHWITSRPSRRWWSCRTGRPRSRLWSAWTRTAASPWLSCPRTRPWRECPRSVRWKKKTQHFHPKYSGNRAHFLRSRQPQSGSTRGRRQAANTGRYAGHQAVVCHSTTWL